MRIPDSDVLFPSLRSGEAAAGVGVGIYIRRLRGEINDGSPSDRRRPSAIDFEGGFYLRLYSAL